MHKEITRDITLHHGQVATVRAYTDHSNVSIHSGAFLMSIEKRDELPALIEALIAVCDELEAAAAARLIV